MPLFHEYPIERFHSINKFNSVHSFPRSRSSKPHARNPTAKSENQKTRNSKPNAETRKPKPTRSDRSPNPKTEKPKPRKPKPKTKPPPATNAEAERQKKKKKKLGPPTDTDVEKKIPDVHCDDRRVAFCVHPKAAKVRLPNSRFSFFTTTLDLCYAGQVDRRRSFESSEGLGPRSRATAPRRAPNPRKAEIQNFAHSVSPASFRSQSADGTLGGQAWQAVSVEQLLLPAPSVPPPLPPPLPSPVRRRRCRRRCNFWSRLRSECRVAMHSSAAKFLGE